jgi:hypothetical protein
LRALWTDRARHGTGRLEAFDTGLKRGNSKEEIGGEFTEYGFDIRQFERTLSEKIEHGQGPRCACNYISDLLENVKSVA